MIDHISLRVSDYDRARAFYMAALAPLGYRLVMEFPGVGGFGVGGKPDFWITLSQSAVNPTHVAFQTDRGAVHRFHEQALAAGGHDHGAPGTRSDYHPNYYAAFALDPDGNVIEAVCHVAEGAAKSTTKKAAKAKKPIKATQPARAKKKPAKARSAGKSTKPQKRAKSSKRR